MKNITGECASRTDRYRRPQVEEAAALVVDSPNGRLVGSEQSVHEEGVALVAKAHVHEVESDVYDSMGRASEASVAVRRDICSRVWDTYIKAQTYCTYV